MPSIARQRVAPGRPSVLASPNLGSRLSQSPRTVERLGRTPTPPIAGNVPGGRGAAPKLATPNTGTPGTVGQGSASGNRTLAAPSQLIQDRNRGLALRNPAFANLSPRDPAMRALAQSTFSGRFAQSAFAHNFFDRRRFRPFFLGVVIGFVGPVFWPYAYDDFIDYTFSPYAYDTFWPHAYDDVFEGIYGAYAPEYAGYGSGGSGYGSGGAAGRYAGAPASRGGRSRTAALTPGTAQICSGQTQGLTDFPIQRIAQQVQPGQDQQALLDELKDATARALDILRAACPSDLPSTPTGRLAAMRTRVEAMMQAVQVVRPALEKFYQSLSDEQKERFNALDAENPGSATAGRQQPDLAQVCGDRVVKATNVPIARIERSLRLSDVQQAALRELEDTTAKAADSLKANCPADNALTPTARLAAMEQRLDAMLRALDTVQPALAKFYGSLDDEQKAQLNRLGSRSA